MQRQKFATEVLLGLVAEAVAMFPAVGMYELRSLNMEMRSWIKDAHLYLICSRPKALLHRIEIRASEMSLAVTLSGPSETTSGLVRCPLPSGWHAAEPALGGRYLAVRTDRPGAPSSLVPLDCILLQVPKLWEQVGQAEVLYVGQAFGRGGQRKAVDRLRSHPTLQRILAVEGADRPERDVFVVLCTVDAPFLITCFEGRVPAEFEGEADAAHLQHAAELSLSTRDALTTVEATAIHHFQPKYNEIFRSPPASKRHLHLKDLLARDFIGVNVVLQLANVRLHLRSTARPEPADLVHCELDLGGPRRRNPLRSP